MNKKNIYAKLFKFTPSKSWYNSEKSVSLSTKKNIVSNFYNEYTLEYINDGAMLWCYNVYSGRSTYHNSHINTGIVTLNKTGKFLFAIAVFFILSIILTLADIKRDIYMHIGLIAGSYLLSFIVVSIFNWKIYRTFRRAKYAANNVKKIQRKEEDERLYDEVTSVVNKTIARDPKLSRKIKLNQLNKKYFWKKWFDKEEKSYDGEQ